MLYLILFAALAIGFFAATTMTAQMSRNDRVVAESQMAAESGLQFARRQVNLMNLTPDPDPATAFGQMYAKLSAQLAGTTNMGGRDPTRFTDASGNDVICIPGTTGTAAGPTYGWMSLGGVAGQTRAVLTRAGSNVTLTAYGRARAAEPIARAVQLTYVPRKLAWTAPGAGVLTRSPVVLSNGAQIAGGDVTVATAQAGVAPLTMSGGTKIEQNFFYTANPKAPVITNGATVAGQIVPNTPMPSFPVVDGSAFEAFVPAAGTTGPKVITATTSIPATATLTNIRIKANANTSFGNAIKLNGVIFVESPNKVTFGGGVTVTGVIVTDGNASVAMASNQITLDNGVRVDGVEALSAANFTPAVWAAERLDDLKDLAGALVLAPNYPVVLAGGARTFNGTMVASKFDISNGYRGTINGSLINLADTSFNMVGGGQITFAGGGGTIPGLYAGSRLVLDLASYLEVPP
ncbi:MAG: hypothetical protein JWO31_3337 [Phycisphaerales bacterium]|nr:hypothetical protein [Phycisphaerales bacterium]